MTRFHGLLLVLIACLAVGLALAGRPARAAQFYTEDLRIPMAEAGPQGLEAFLVRPAGTKRYPLALLSHGSPRSFDDRATMSAHKYYGIALEYARRGFAALIVMRRGYGTSPGGRVDRVGGCANAAYLPAAAVAVADLRAAIDAMARRPDVTTTGMIAAGHSAGGLATVALTAQAPPDLVAAISFAGFRANGGNAKFAAAPPYGDDGHYLYSVVARPQWTPYVDAFLRERGLSHDMLGPPDPPPPPSHFSEAAKAEFARYLASTMPHKAFAVSPNGGYGWRSGRNTVDDAQRDSLAACMKWSPTCTLYAVDDQLAEATRQITTDQSARTR